MSVYEAMKKDKVYGLPSTERSSYILQKAHEDYKNLTSSELQAYQKMAEHFKKDKHVGKPHKISVFSVMMKDLAAKLPKKQRQEYIISNAASDYNNLTAQEREEYEKMAKECNKKREKIFEIIQHQRQHRI